MIQDLGWRDLNQCRVDSRLCMLYKISQGLVDIPIGQFLKYNRNGVHFQTIYARTKYYEFSFFPRTVAAWNEFSGDTLSTQNLAVFKQNNATIDHVMPWDYKALSRSGFYPSLLLTLLPLSLFSLFLTNNCFFLFSTPAHSL